MIVFADLASTVPRALSNKLNVSQRPPGGKKVTLKDNRKKLSLQRMMTRKKFFLR